MDCSHLNVTHAREKCIQFVGSHLLTSVGGIVVSIAAFQAVDPGSIPGHRRLFLWFWSRNSGWISETVMKPLSHYSGSLKQGLLVITVPCGLKVAAIPHRTDCRFTRLGPYFTWRYCTPIVLTHFRRGHRFRACGAVAELLGDQLPQAVLWRSQAVDRRLHSTQLSHQVRRFDLWGMICNYRVSHLLVDWVGLTWILSGPLSTLLCFWGFSRSG